MKSIIIILLCFLSASVKSTNITINDGYGTLDNGWYSANRENQETEINCTIGQIWDMESFELNGSVLRMTGGYNFTDPTGTANSHGGYWRSGDLFFDVDGGGYDYVALIRQATSTYDVYKLGNTYSVYYGENSASNPWRYKDGGSLFVLNRSVSYSSYSDIEGIHYMLDTDIAWLPTTPGNTVRVHYTMECGNDNLLGEYKVKVSDTGNALILLVLTGFLIKLFCRR